MKKITLFFAAALVSVAVNAQTTISHSTSQTVDTGSVACANAGGGYTTDNMYYRTYTLVDFGLSDQMVTGGEFGMSFADSGGTNPTVSVLVQAFTTDAVFPGGTLTPIAMVFQDVSLADDGTVIPFVFDTPASIGDTDEIVIEVAFPSGDPAVNGGDTFDVRIGQNLDGETAPSYIATTDCGGITPITFDDLGFPGNAIINMTVEPDLGVGDTINELVSIYPNPTTDLLNVTIPASVEIHAANLYDITGRDTGVALVNGTMNVADLSRGVYMLNVRTSAGTLNKKIIKR
jgi:hypothetical protein